MKTYKEVFDILKKEISKVIIGQDEMIDQIIVAMLCDGNVLLEGYPGLAKTLTVRTISDLMDLKFSRVQNTPDLMPSDITGTYIIDESKGKKEFKFQKGPVFTNILLADEINRATPKTQSALLEAMQEKQVTVGNQTFKLDTPFFVLATQNPIEQEGTYPLPEAQADRFLLKVLTKYPTEDEEEAIVDRFTSGKPLDKVKKILTRERLMFLQARVKEVPIANDIKMKAIRIVTTTRNSKQMLEYGASPRASLALIMSAKASALMNGRNHVSMDDIKQMAYPVLRHRIILNFEAERRGMTVDDVITEIIKKVK